MSEDTVGVVVNQLAVMDTDAVPYDTLCRSVLDLDPSALFLALYRCLEALYAHGLVRELSNTLKITMSWIEMAQILEAKLGWYPREEPSLEALLKHAAPGDLEAVASALNDPVSPGGR